MDCLRRIVVASLCLFSLGICASPKPARAQNDPWLPRRQKMVSDFIEREGVSNARVLTSMRQVPRHEFVQPSQKGQAYLDMALPIGFKQTISPPFIVAYMTETIDPQPTDKILEIGTGSGYQAAVLSNLCQDVYTIEIVEGLGRSAKERLKKLHYDNVHCLVGDGYKGWPDSAPFDKIIVTCSPEAVPQPLVDQLKEGGRMLIPLGERYQQVFHLLIKKEGKLETQLLLPVLFVPMTGKAEDERQVQPDPLHPQILNGDFEEDANGDMMADHWYYQRMATRMADDPPSGNHYLRLSNTETDRVSQVLEGIPVAGNKIKALHIKLRVRGEGIKPGAEVWEKAALSINFYDEVRRLITDVTVGPFSGTFDWHEESKVITVPAKAREAIVRIGLNGAVGTLDVDDLRMTIEER